MDVKQFNTTAKECLTSLQKTNKVNVHEVQEKITKMREFSIQEMIDVNFDQGLSNSTLKAIDLRIEIIKSLDKKLDDVCIFYNVTKRIP
jgi:hypothetical protein